MVFPLPFAELWHRSRGNKKVAALISDLIPDIPRSTPRQAALLPRSQFDQSIPSDRNGFGNGVVHAGRRLAGGVCNCSFGGSQRLVAVALAVVPAGFDSLLTASATDRIPQFSLEGLLDDQPFGGVGQWAVSVRQRQPACDLHGKGVVGLHGTGNSVVHGVHPTVVEKRMVNRSFAPFPDRGGSLMSSSGILLTSSIRPAGPVQKIE